MILESDKIILKGASLENAKKVLFLLHGRGDSARSFVNFAGNLDISKEEFAIVALQAKNNTWYPFSFLMPLAQNEPYLSQSLADISEVLQNLGDLDFKNKDIFFLGFSQGACLCLEFCARNAQTYGGVIAFTGGLLGDRVNTQNYHGNFNSTPIFLGASDNDPHVPEGRIDESETILIEMGAKVNKKIYPGLGHTINADELKAANTILNK